jgi:HK97 family phage portal protein
MALLHQRPRPSLWRRAWQSFALRAGRRRMEPQRKTDIYARLKQIGSWNLRDSRPTIKPVPANLRYFSRTPYATRAISLYSRPISMLDWQVVPREGVKENSEIKRQIEIATACLHSPNHDDSLVSLLQQIVEDICVCGAGAIEQQPGGDKIRPLWLWPVDALSIQIYADWDGDANRPRYCQTYGYGNVGVAQGKDLLNRELIYMRERPTTDTPFAVGALEVAFQTINRQLGVAEYSGNVAANAHPANILWMKGASVDEREAFRAYWRNEIEGQGQVPIVGSEDAKVLALREATDNGLFLKYQQFVIREIATAFGISPQNLGIEADVNRNTSEVAEDRDWDLGIKPMAKMIARYINREAIWGSLGFSQIELTPGGLDREDEKASADIFKIEYEGNAITPNEYRARRNLPPLESAWGDMVYADAQIAIKGAQGAKQVNPDLVDKE